MNLRQAYDGWGQQEQNRQLYVRTREAFRKAWFTLPTNKPCSWYTKDVLALALAETRVVESDKVKAASVMIHVLTWANFAEPKYNPAPDFKMEDVTRLMRLPADELEKERERITAAMQEHTGTVPTYESGNDNTEGLSPACSIAPKSEATTDDDADPLAGIDFNDTNDKPNDETNMSNEKKPRGKQPKPVAQLAPTTLQVVKVWPSRCEAERETGACNIDRCIAHHRMSAGYYWCQPDEVNGFKPNPLSGNQPKQYKKKGGRPANPGLPLHLKDNCSEEVSPSTGKEHAGDGSPINAPLSQREPSPCAPSAAEKALAVFTDDELLKELDRRGWEGELSRRQVVTIGARE